MQIQVVKSKIHRVKCTGAELNYIGSITIDEDLISLRQKVMTAYPNWSELELKITEAETTREHLFSCPPEKQLRMAARLQNCIYEIPNMIKTRLI